MNPASRTTGSPLTVSSCQRSGVAVATDSGNPAARHALRSVSDSSHQASWAPWPTCAIVLPADISSSGLSQSTGPSGSGAAGGSGSSRSVPDTWSLASSLGQPSSGIGGYTRTSALPPVTVIPGSSAALRHSAPRARRTTLRIRASSQSRIAPAHSPSPVDRSSARIVSTARAAVRRASVRAGGAVFSRCTTRGSTYCGAASRSVGPCWKGLGGTGAWERGLWEVSSLLTVPVCQAASATSLA